MRAPFRFLLPAALLSTALAAPADPVRFAALLEQMRGHYDASLLNYKAGNLALAAKHATHPAHELYASVKGDLSPALRQKFLADFDRLDALLRAKAPYAQYQQAANAFYADVDTALASLGALRRDPKFAAQVIAAMLENAESEYSEGVQGGKVTNLAEYQDARFYVARAQRWFDAQRAAFPAHQRDETAAALTRAAGVIAKTGPTSDLAAAVDSAQEELAEISGVERAQAGTGTYFANIEALLSQAKAHYAAGDTDAAEEALIGAYLDNFEHLEGPLLKKDQALEARLERSLAQELRALLKRRPAPATFNAAVDAARADLKKAQAVLED